jgi:predicted DNA-binding WGR domain protein
MVHGVDLECVNTYSNKFYRLLHVGTRVYIRYGVRGTDGATHTKGFATNEQARKFYASQEAAKVRKGYQVTSRYGLELEDGANAPVLVAPASPGESSLVWVVVQYAVEGTSRAPLANSYLDNFRVRPHLYVESEDLLLAQTLSTHRSTAGRRASTIGRYHLEGNIAICEVLGSVSHRESIEEMRAVMTLYTPNHPDTASLFEVAKIMASAH